MKISVRRDNLAQALQIVSRMVKNRVTLPVLANIMLATDKGRLKLSATDLEAAVVTWVGVKIDEEGALTIPARTLVDFISTISDETITLTSEGADVLIKTAKNMATIKGIAAEEFPIIPQINSDSPIEIPAGTLKQAILSVAVAAALDETRPVLSGVLLRFRGTELKIVSTDSYRLAELTYKISAAEKPQDVILPARTANELARILPSDDSIVSINLGDNQAEFKFAEIQFVSRQIEGTFPDYEQIIPKDFVFEFTLPKRDLEEAIKLNNIFARDAGNNIKVSTTDGEVIINSISAQSGDAEARLKVAAKGSPLTVAFNAKYLLDGLNVLIGEEATVGLSGPLSPGMITNPEDKGFKYIIMPLRAE